MTLEERIEALEKSNRRLRCGIMVMIVCAGAALYAWKSVPTAVANAPAAIPDVIRTRRLEVVGSNNQPTIVLNSVQGYSEMRRTIPESVVFSLEAWESHGGEIILRNQQKSATIWMNAVTNKASINIRQDESEAKLKSSDFLLFKVDRFAESQESRLFEKLVNDEEMSDDERELLFRAAVGKRRVELTSTEEAGGVINVYNNKGKGAASVRVDDANSGFVGIYDGFGRLVRALTIQ